MSSTQSYERILQFEMYSREIGFLFSTEFFNSAHIKQLIIDRHTAGRQACYREMDAGIIYARNDAGFDEICSRLEVDNSRTLLCYEEIKRDICMALDDNLKIKSNAKLSTVILDGNEEYTPRDLSYRLGVDISETMACLVNELIMLDRLSEDYSVKSGFDFADEKKYPVRSARYSERQLYLKILALFCGEFGFSAGQLLELAEISCRFEISSNHLSRLLELICEIPGNSCGEAVQAIVKSGSIADKEALLTDMLLLVFLGRYDIQTEFEAVEKAGMLLDENMDLVFEIYYNHIKEIQV